MTIQPQDIQLKLFNQIGNLGNFFDVGVLADSSDLSKEIGLETACAISLFTDAQAKTTEVPTGTNRRGWWGDMFATTQDDAIGSKLWLLDRSKETPDVLPRAEEYARAALQWLLDDGVASSITVAASFPKPATLLLSVGIQRPNTQTLNYNFQVAWQGQLAR